MGGGGAAFGPLVGGWILEHFAWGAIFLINIPIIIMSVLLILRYIPEQKIDKSQSLSFLQAVVLVSSILLIIYAMKTGMYQMSFAVLGILLLGLTLLGLFVRHQLNSTHLMIDFQLFRHPVIATSMLMVIFSMAALVGFELLLSQELQFVYHFSPFEAGLFLLPLMIAISVGGPFSSILMNRYSLRYVASIGLLMCALSFWGLAMTHFIEQSMQAKILMFALGISVEVAFLSSTAAIMSAVPAEKATAAGAIEGMGYELGAGLGVAFFGLLLSFFYSQSIVLPTDLPQEMLLGAERTIAEAVQVAQHLEGSAAAQLIQAANQAFSYSHARVLGIAGWIFLITAFFVWLNLAPKKANSC